MARTRALPQSGIMTGTFDQIKHTLGYSLKRTRAILAHHPAVLIKYDENMVPHYTINFSVPAHNGEAEEPEAYSVPSGPTLEERVVEAQPAQEVQDPEILPPDQELLIPVAKQRTERSPAEAAEIIIEPSAHGSAVHYPGQDYEKQVPGHGKDLPAVIERPEDIEKMRAGDIRRRVILEILGGAETVEDFMKRRIGNIDDFMAEFDRKYWPPLRKECQKMIKNKEIIYNEMMGIERKIYNGIGRYVYARKRGLVLMEDYQNIFEKYLSSLGLHNDLSEMERIINTGKVADIYTNMKYEKMQWNDLKKIYDGVVNSERRKVFARTMTKYKKADLDFPKPPKEFRKGKHEVYDMVLSLRLPYVNILLLATTKLTELLISEEYMRDAEKRKLKE